MSLSPSPRNRRVRRNKFSGARRKCVLAPQIARAFNCPHPTLGTSRLNDVIIILSARGRDRVKEREYENTNLLGEEGENEELCTSIVCLRKLTGTTPLPRKSRATITRNKDTFSRSAKRLSLVCGMEASFHTSSHVFVSRFKSFSSDLKT